MFSHIMASQVRYCEALTAVRKILDSCTDDEGLDAPSSQEDTTDTGGGSSIDSDEDTLFAAPAEASAGPRSALKGSRGYSLEERVAFFRNHHSTCPAGLRIDALVDGSWCPAERGRTTTMSMARAIARARRQRCEVVSDVPACERTPL